jgi:hypothetical protein
LNSSRGPQFTCTVLSEIARSTPLPASLVLCGSNSGDEDDVNILESKTRVILLALITSQPLRANLSLSMNWPRDKRVTPFSPTAMGGVEAQVRTWLDGVTHAPWMYPERPNPPDTWGGGSPTPLRYVTIKFYVFFSPTLFKWFILVWWFSQALLREIWGLFQDPLDFNFLILRWILLHLNQSCVSSMNHCLKQDTSMDLCWNG